MRSEGTTYGAMVSSLSAERTQPLLVFAIAAVAIAVFVNAFGGEFVYDDIALVRDNVRIRSLGSMGEIVSSNWWGDLGNRGLYRPVAMATYALNHAVTGLSYNGFLFVNRVVLTVVVIIFLEG